MKIKRLINNPKKNNHIYIYPNKSSDDLAKYISALANSKGGLLIFGIHDDGVKLFVKGSRLTINLNEIKHYLDSTVEIILEKEMIDGEIIEYINIPKSKRIVRSQGQAYVLNKNNVEIFREKEIFLSYSHQDSILADRIERDIKEQFSDKVKIIRDIYSLEYKNSLTKFMKSIKKYEHVIVILSDSYLKSKACMYEMYEFMKDDSYKDKLIFFTVGEEELKYYGNEKVLSDIKPKIYSNEKFEYTMFWDKEYKKLNEILSKTSSPELTVEIAEELKLVKKIAMNCNELVSTLSDLLGQSYSEIYKDNYKSVKKCLMIDE